VVNATAINSVSSSGGMIYYLTKSVKILFAFFVLHPYNGFWMLVNLILGYKYTSIIAREDRLLIFTLMIKILSCFSCCSSFQEHSPT